MTRYVGVISLGRAISRARLVLPRRGWMCALAVHSLFFDPLMGRASAQHVKIVSTSTAPCRGCGLTLDSIATVGGGQGPGEYFARPSLSAVIPNGRLAVSATVPVHIFSLTGGFVQTLGRRGQGPGEFPSWITGMAAGGAGTLHVFVAQQAIVFDSTLRFVRNATFAQGSQRTTVLANGNYVGLARLPTAPGPPTARRYAETFQQPLFHVFDSTGAHLRSVGSTMSMTDDIIAPGAASTIWTAKRAPYELKQWTQDGVLLRVIERVTPFFDRKAYAGPWPYIPGNGPRPHFLVVHQDSHGVLWTAVRVVKADWAKAIKAGDSHCCESLIEALDPLTGNLLGSARVALHVQQILDDGFVAAVAEGKNGEPLLVLYRAHLTPPGR